MIHTVNALNVQYICNVNGSMSLNTLKPNKYNVYAMISFKFKLLNLTKNVSVFDNYLMCVIVIIYF